MSTRLLPTTPPVSGSSLLTALSDNNAILFSTIILPAVTITNTGNDYTITIDPPLTADVADGMSFLITPNAANSGAVRMRVTSANPYYPIVDVSGAALVSGAFDPVALFLITFMSGSFRIINSSQVSNAQKPANHQDFSSSGTWTKPVGFSNNSVVLVRLWAGGGGAGSYGGGGGGFTESCHKLSDIPGTVTVTIGSGGAGSAGSAGGAGGDTSFGSYSIAYGGGGGGTSTPGLGGWGSDKGGDGAQSGDGNRSFNGGGGEIGRAHV